MPHWPWIERTFRFDFPTGKMPDLLERVVGLTRNVLTRREGAGWTIQENVGHLIDLGYLPVKRIAQILAGEATLIAADMKNEKTHAARHNERTIGELLAKFRRQRMALACRGGSPEDSVRRDA